MKGAVGFLVGIIGLCLFASVSLLIPNTMRHEAFAVFLVVIVVAFVFLNILLVGFFRMLGHLHETVLYPDDPYSYPQRGRALFFVGYVGLLLTLVFAVFVALLPELTRGRFGHRESEIVLLLTWFMGWIFFGCLLGGVLAMLSDIFHKAFYRTTVDPPDAEPNDALDISHHGSRRSDPTDDKRPRPWDNE